MKAITKVLAGGVAIAALASAAPAAAQYYPGYGYGGNVVGQVLSQVLGGGYGYNNGYGYNGSYGVNSQTAVNQCANAVQARLGGYNNYGNGYGGAGRVLGISRVEPRNNGGLTVRGVASSGRYGASGYGAQAQADITWKCKVDYRGYVSDIDLNRASNYGYGNYTPYGAGNYDYSQYGYRRY